MRAAAGPQRCRSRPLEQVWLPNLQVWAAVGSQPVRTGSPASTGSGNPPVDVPSSAICGTASPGRMMQAVTPVETCSETTVVTNVLHAEANIAVDDALPTCPICLTEISQLEDKAVLNSCMHVFCVSCISRWAAKKRVCPLCKGRIQGYMYNIKSEQDYQERIIPPSPERPSSPPVRSSLLSRWGPTPHSLIDSFATSTSTATQAQSLQEFREHWRNTAQYYFGSSGHQLQQSGRRIAITPSQTANQRQAGSSATGSREPRPYYYRVQQQMQAGMASQAPRSVSSSQAAPVDATTAWRRNIYADAMYAVSAGSQPAAVPASLAAAPDRSRRLQDWVDRELQALLDQEDVSVVRSFVMSLATTHGLHRHQTRPNGQHQQQSSSACEEETIAALRPFLHEQTAHFWHELKCFAEAPYSMATYDRVVQYQRRVSQSTQVESAANITSLPNRNLLQRHLSRGEQAALQAALQAASWTPPHSANAAAPSSAMPSSLQQATLDRPAAESTSQHSRPSAPYLSRHSGLQPSRHKPHSVSTAAAADKRQLAQERRLDAQHSRRLRPVADNATAAEVGGRILAPQRVALHQKSQVASETRLHAAAGGVIDLTTDDCSASPSTSTSSDCMILGGSVVPQDPVASASARCTHDWAQAGPSCITEEPVEPPRVAHSIGSAEAGAAELWQSSNAVTQLPRGCDWLGDLSSGSASARAVAEPWQSSNLVSQVLGEDDRPAEVRGSSARPGGSSLGPPWEPSAQLTMLSTGAQAASSHGRRSRWDVMPASMSTDIRLAQQPPPSEAPSDLPARSHDSNAAHPARAETAAMSVTVQNQAEGQSLHSQQPTDHALEVTIDSRLEQSEAATQQKPQVACRSPHQAQKPKPSCTGRKHSRHSRHRSSSCSSHSRSRRHSRSSQRIQRSYKHCRHWHSGSPDVRLPVDRRYISGSSSGHARHFSDKPDLLYARIDSQRQTTPDNDERLHAAMHGEASQDDRWQMWQPQDV